MLSESYLVSRKGFLILQ